MSKELPGGARAGKRFSVGGRAGRAPGRGYSDHASTRPKGERPAKGFGSKGLGGRPPKDPKG